MDAGKRRYNTGYYTDGSTARKLAAMPDYDRGSYRDYDTGETVRSPKRTAEPVRRARTLREPRPSGLDFKSVLFISMAIIATVYVCVGYLGVQADITGKSKQIAALESEIMGLKNANTAARDQINSSIDLTHVYRVATEELGMVHANRNQVIEYESTKSNFVRQYGDIPEGNDTGLLGRLLGGK